MAVPNPTITSGLSTLVALMTAEAGMIISGFDYEASSEVTWVNDASLGYDVGFWAGNFQLSGSVKGKISTAGTNPVGAVIPGAVMTLGNSTSLNGITAGAVFALSVAGSHTEKQFRDVTTNWIKKPGVTSA